MAAAPDMTHVLETAKAMRAQLAALEVELKQATARLTHIETALQRMEAAKNAAVAAQDTP